MIGDLLLKDANRPVQILGRPFNDELEKIKISKHKTIIDNVIFLRKCNILVGEII